MLPDTVAALAGKNRVSVATLYEFKFASSTRRFWNGLGYLTAGGEEWQGAGKIISISSMEQARGMTAPQASFTLTGASDDLIAFAANSEAEVKGYPCAVYLQFLGGPFQTLDDPIAIWTGVMDLMSFRAGVRNQSITLTAESLFDRRARAPFGYMTDTDQQMRWPGDRGMEFMALLINKTVKWLRG